jgi:hypothetical protein
VTNAEKVAPNGRCDTLPFKFPYQLARRVLNTESEAFNRMPSRDSRAAAKGLFTARFGTVVLVAQPRQKANRLDRYGSAD